MSSSFIFANGQIFSLGNHGFYPIVDRITASSSETEKAVIEPIHRPTMEGFDFLVLDESIDPEAFRCFCKLARNEYERCAKSNEAAKMAPRFYDGIMKSWMELVQRMEADPRCGSAPTGQ